MRKVNQAKQPGTPSPAPVHDPAPRYDSRPVPASAQPCSAQSLASCQSADDFARLLHTLGWRGILDAQWTNLETLWTQIKALRP